MDENVPEPKRNFSLESAFDFIYMIILVGLIGYGAYIFIMHRDEYHLTELIRISYYYIPVFVFSIVGIMKIRSDRSFIYALVSGVVAFILLVFFYNTIYPML